MPDLRRLNVAGPLLISVGEPSQLRRFFELNPELEGMPALVDPTETFDAYRAAGFTNLLGDVQLSSPPDFKPPTNLGPGRWLAYLGNVAGLAPKPKRFGEVPQGVRVLGGTYLIDDDAITFAHEDDVPGATPNVADVLAAAR